MKALTSLQAPASQLTPRQGTGCEGRKLELNHACTLQKQDSKPSWIPAQEQHLQIQQMQVLAQRRAGGESLRLCFSMNQKDAMQTAALSKFPVLLGRFIPLPLKSLDQSRSRKLAEKMTCLQWSET